MTCGVNTLPLIVGANNVVEHRAVINNVTGLPDSGASVALTIYANDGSPLPGQAWPAQLTYQAGETPEALYRVTLDATLQVEDGVTYLGLLEVTGTGGERDQRNPVFEGVTRRDS